MITLIEWSDEYSVGVNSLDKEHKKIIGMLNRLINDHTSEPIEVVNDMFSEIFQFKDEHFVTEEEFMKKNKYPELQRHKEEHNKFKRETASMCKKLMNSQNPNKIREEMLVCLRKWFEFHILTEDMKYAAFYKNTNLCNEKI